MLTVTSVHLEDIRRHSEASYPEECCGILIGLFDGDRRIVHATVRCLNASAGSRSTQYSIDPIEVIRAQRDAREHGLEVVGFYHSHPDHPAHWSPTDLDEAHWIGCSCLIVAVENGRAATTASFVLSGTREEDKAFTQERLLVEFSAQLIADSR
jgi:proteasome lid subunit RPN8/RPN11